MEVWRVAWGTEEGRQADAVHFATERGARAAWERRIQLAREGLLWNSRYVWLMRVRLAPFLSDLLARGRIDQGHVCDLLNCSKAVLDEEVVDRCETAGDGAIVHQ